MGTNHSQTHNKKKTGSASSTRERGPFRVVLLDGDLMFRQGLECLFEQTPQTKLVGSISSPGEIAACLSRGAVDLIVFELNFHFGDPIECIRDWSSSFPEVSLIVLSSKDESIFGERCLRAGAAGFFSKTQSFSALVEGFFRIEKGELAASPNLEAVLLSRYNRLRAKTDAPDLDALSNRELLVLNLVGDGKGNSAIAKTLGVSPKTVGTYKERIKDKLALSDAYQLAQIANYCVSSNGKHTVNQRT